MIRSTSGSKTEGTTANAGTGESSVAILPLKKQAEEKEIDNDEIRAWFSRYLCLVEWESEHWFKPVPKMGSNQVLCQLQPHLSPTGPFWFLVPLHL